MTEVVWGPIAKGIEDKTTIEAFVNNKFAVHNQDASSHGQAGEAIATHRINEIIDHLAESVVNSKIKYKARGFSAIVDAAGGGDYISIQDAIDYVHSKGGGNILILNGTYVLASDIVLYSNILLQGESQEGVILNFASSAFKVVCQGSDSYYSTGIVGVTKGSKIVTGSGTSWLANVVAGSYIFIYENWYKIDSVDSDTEITLCTSYASETDPSIVYRVCVFLENVIIRDLSVISGGSADEVIKVRAVEEIVIDNVFVEGLKKGMYVGFTDHLKVINCEISVSGIYDAFKLSPYCSGTLFSNNKVFSLLGDGCRFDMHWDTDILYNKVSCGGEAIELVNGDRCSIVGNLIDSEVCGIHLQAGCSFNSVFCNSIDAGSGDIMQIRGAYNSIIGNTQKGADSMALLITGNRNVVVGNVLREGMCYLRVEGDKNVIDANSIRSYLSYGIYVTGLNNVISSNRVCVETVTGQGIRLFEADNTVISSNLIETEYRGIALSTSNGCSISNNKIIGGDVGIRLYRSSYNCVNGNRIIAVDAGIYLNDASYNYLDGNYIQDVATGIDINDALSTYNRLHGTYCRNCTQPLIDNGLFTSIADSYSN